MKAKEYYEKYKLDILSVDQGKYIPATQNFIQELFAEMQTISKARNVRFDRGLISIMKEQNDKYKAVVRLFEKEFGASPLRLDGFEMILERRFPGVLEKMKK